jgi:hypothetical protein
MRGDEDLGQDITMKGQPFHYNQLVQTKEEPAKEEEKKEGDGKAKKEESKKPTNGCEEGEVLAEDGHCYFEGELVKLRNHKSARTAFYAQASNKGVQWTEGNGSLPPERVSIVEPVIGKSQTTFYTQKDQSLIQTEKEDNKWNANREPEKVHDLIPEAYRHASNSADNYPGIRTAFYAQMSDDGEKKAEAKTEEKADKKQNQYADELKTGAIGGANGEPEKVHVLHTPIAKTHTTFYLGKSQQATNLQT